MTRQSARVLCVLLHSYIYLCVSVCLYVCVCMCMCCVSLRHITRAETAVCMFYEQVTVRTLFLPSTSTSRTTTTTTTTTTSTSTTTTTFFFFLGAYACVAIAKVPKKGQTRNSKLNQYKEAEIRKNGTRRK